MNKTIKNYFKELKDGIKVMFKEFFNKDTNKKQRANMWTFSRLITSFLIPICSLVSLLTGNPVLVGVAITITGFGALTDFFDGRSARKYNSSSEFGAMLDQISDKIFSIMIGLNLSLFNPLFLISLLGETSIAILNITYKLKFNNLKIKSTQIGRIKQWPLSISLLLGITSLFVPSLISITNISIVLTLLFQFATICSYLKTNKKNIKIYQDNQLKNNIDYKQIIEEYNTQKIKSKEYNNNVQVGNKVNRNNIYDDLIKLRNELINNAKVNDNENNYQKIKK